MLITLSIIAVRRRQQDAYVLMAALGLYCLAYGLWWLLGHVVFFWAPLNQLAEAFTANILPSTLADLGIVVAFLGVVLVRTLRIVRERAAIANEIEAARTMQQLLLAQSNQPTPGFQVDSVYLPAGEVGGDFFLVSPCAMEGEEPSLTVIVGDVSGKGLRAAMRVSMILGVLRREPSREPAAMLHGLNQALADEGDTGFTTACCVRLCRDGRYTRRQRRAHCAVCRRGGAGDGARAAAGAGAARAGRNLPAACRASAARAAAGAAVGRRGGGAHAEGRAVRL